MCLLICVLPIEPDSVLVQLSIWSRDAGVSERAFCRVWLRLARRHLLFASDRGIILSSSNKDPDVPPVLSSLSQVRRCVDLVKARTRASDHKAGKRLEDFILFFVAHQVVSLFFVDNRGEI